LNDFKPIGVVEMISIKYAKINISILNMVKSQLLNASFLSYIMKK